MSEFGNRFFSKAGMITGAAWADVTGDGDGKELVITPWEMDEHKK
jgi:hypothetical protein